MRRSDFLPFPDKFTAGGKLWKFYFAETAADSCGRRIVTALIAGRRCAGYGEKITVIVPSGVTKIEVRYEENETAQEEAKGAKDIRLDGVIIPEPCYLAALKHAVATGSISISIVQRRLSVGYPKAGKIIEWMEDNGFISAFSGSVARKVYLTREQLEKLSGKAD